MPHPAPGSRIVDRVPVGRAVQPWPSQTVRYIRSSWRGPLHMRVEGVEAHLRYVAFHEHRGQGRYPLHHHPYAEILLTVAGHGAVELESGARVACRPGSVLVLPPRMSHASVWRAGGRRWSLLVIDFDLAVDAAQLPLEAGVSVDPAFSPFYEWFFVRRQAALDLRPSDWQAARAIVADLRSSLTERAYGVGSEMLSSLLRLVALLSRSLRRQGLADGRRILPPQHSPESALLAARTRMEGRVVFDPGVVRRLAAGAGYSEEHFVRAFRATFGITPKRYAQTLLMRRAAGLLQGTDLPVRAVADRLGYADASTFSRAFRRFVGTSPESFRTAGPRAQRHRQDQ